MRFTFSRKMPVLLARATGMPGRRHRRRRLRYGDEYHQHYRRYSRFSADAEMRFRDAISEHTSNMPRRDFGPAPENALLLRALFHRYDNDELDTARGRDSSRYADAGELARRQLGSPSKRDSVGRYHHDARGAAGRRPYFR